MRPDGPTDVTTPDRSPAAGAPEGASAVFVAQRPVVVIPTYNERDNLPGLVERLRESVPQAAILVVDDDSPDGTGARADEMAAADDQVRVLHRAGKAGLGAAYRAGFRRALADGHDAVVQMDADFSHDPAGVPGLLQALDEADLVLGSRYVRGGGTVGWGWGRRVLSRGGSLYARTILGMRQKDLTGGFKAWRAELLRRIPLDDVGAQGYAFQIEMSFRAHRRGARIREIPIVFEDRRVGQSKMNASIALEAIRMCWWLRWRVR